MFGRKLLLLSMAVAIFLSCEKGNGEKSPAPQAVEYSFSAVSEALSKSVVGDDNVTVQWNKGDRFSIFDGEQNLLFTADSDGASTGLSSLGKLSSSVGSVLALYPYNASAYLSTSGSVSVIVPSEQSPREGTFDPLASPALAFLEKLSPDETNVLKFMNVCAFLKISMSDAERISKIRISAENETTALVGEVKMKINDDGKPEMRFIVNSESAVTAKSVESSFDGAYLVAVLPTDTADKFHVTATTSVGYEIPDAIVTEPMVLERGKVYDFGSIESPDAPQLSCNRFFWSDAEITWIFAGGAREYRIYLDGMEIAAVPPTERSYHIENLDPGRTYKVRIAADTGTSQLESNQIEISTGNIRQLVKNVSPTSVAVAFDNMSGGQAGNFNPCFYVQLFDNAQGAGTPIYEAYVLDSEKVSQGHPFYGSLLMSENSAHAPTAVSFGALEPGKDYWFRVRAVASHTYKEYVTANSSEQTASSYKGDSNYSALVKLSTAPSHIKEENEIFFQGFDMCSMEADFINCAVGICPAFKTAGGLASEEKYDAIFADNTNGWIFWGLRTNQKASNIYDSKWLSQNTTAGDYKFYSVSSETGKPCSKPSFAAVPKYGSVTQARIGTFYKTKFPELEGWIATNGIYPHEGYFACGTFYNKNDKNENTSGMGSGAALMTPILTDARLSATEDAECILSFKALAVQGRTGIVSLWHYDHDGAAAKADNWKLLTEFNIQNSNGVAENSSSWDATSDTHKWYEYSYTLKLGKNDAIGFGFDGGACICFDDVKILLKETP